MLSQEHLQDYVTFPSVKNAQDGIVCVGGELLPEVLITAYRNGIFPWYNEGEEILWWSPEERCVVNPGKVKESKSMRPLLNSTDYRITVDTCFPEVISNCRHIERPTQDGTWLVDEMEEAYNQLHELGIAHSFEVKNKDQQLVGGLYGVSIGGMFYGESMFSKQKNMSKLAFIYLSRFLHGMRFDMIDCQVVNPHLLSMGCVEIPRNEFIKVNRKSVSKKTQIGAWTQEFDAYWINR